MVNDKDHVFIEKGGLLTRADASFRDDRHLLQIIDRIVSRVGRRVDESSPMVDARLPDGSRAMNAIIPPLTALDAAPPMSIRRFGTGPAGGESAGADEEYFRGDDGTAVGCGPGTTQHSDLRRNGRRQNDLPEYSFAIHSAKRARHHD